MDSIILEWISQFYQWSDELQSSTTSEGAEGLEAIFRGFFYVIHKLFLLGIIALVVYVESIYFPDSLYWTVGAIILIEILHVLGQRI